MPDYNINTEFVKELDEQILQLIQKGVEVSAEALFNQLALTEFNIQYHNIARLQQYAQERGITPEQITAWEQIPAIPTAVFKDEIIAAFPLDDTELVTMTSGTSNPHLPAKIYRDKRCVELLFLANNLMTRTYLFPDVERMKLLLMVPSPEVAPAMGMAVGLEQMRQNFGTAESIYLINQDGMAWELLFEALQQAEATGELVAIVGATSGLVYLMKFCQEQGLHFNLPPGSRICDGGGYLGIFGDCSREEYLQLCQTVLGVSAEFCVNTLGSSESGTNYFDNVLRNYYLQLSGIPRFKPSPPWTRTIAVDPVTGQRLPCGEVGILCHYDLVNRANLVALRTNNYGYETPTGFEILGRTDTQKCSTAADNMLGGANICSTVADNLLAKSPHGNMFLGISPERLAKLKEKCPFLKIQGLFKKNKYRENY